MLLSFYQTLPDKFGAPVVALSSKFVRLRVSKLALRHQAYLDRERNLGVAKCQRDDVWITEPVRKGMALLSAIRRKLALNSSSHDDVFFYFFFLLLINYNNNNKKIEETKFRTKIIIIIIIIFVTT